MDIRRVQITGGSSFMITLPKEWANSVGLNKNDKVGVLAHPDGSLSLYPSGSAPLSKRSTKIIDTTNIRDRGFLHRQLLGAYIAGHSMIMVRSDKPLTGAVTSTVASFVQTSIGLEILEADETHILVTDLIEHDPLDPKRMIERMRLLLKSMISDVFEASFSGDIENVKDMKARDTQIDRIFWLISRQCNIYQKDLSASHRMTTPLHELTACFSLSRAMEAIGNHSMMMANYLLMINDLGKKQLVDKNAHEAGNKIIALFTNAVNSWIDKDIVLAERVIKESEEIVKEYLSLGKQNIEENHIGASAAEVVRFSSKRVAEYCAAIAELTFYVAME